MHAKTMRRLGGRPAGMTLIELIIVIAIIGIVSGVAIPGILGGIQRTGVNGAARRLADDIRLAQSSALTRGMQSRLIVFDETGVVPMSPSNLTDTTKANKYRIEIRSSASVAWPALTDDPGSNPNVLTAWSDLSAQFGSVAVTTGNALTFNSIGGITNSTVPVNVVLQGSGGTRTVQTNVIGKATIL